MASKYALLALLLPACASLPQRAPLDPPPVLYRAHPAWPPDAYPLELRLSMALDECQRSAVFAAVAWWEARTALHLFAVRDVPASDAAVLGIPQVGVVSVSPVAALDTPTTLGIARAWNWHDETIAYVEVEIVGCSPRVAAHELGHALGLPHSDLPGALMCPRHSTDSWAVSGAELAAVVGE